MSILSSTGISITTEKLGKRFNREWIFRNFTFVFKGRNTYAITGPNGSGKSTLLQILWGQSLPTTGSLQYSGVAADIPVTEIFNHISIATPYMDLIDEFTLNEQVDFHFKLKRMRQGVTREEMVERMYLTQSRDKLIGNFSSGMRQRLKLALAFFTEADLLFLDEPGTNLDKQAFEWYTRELQVVSNSTLVLIASNNKGEYNTATDVIRIEDFK